MLISLLLSLRNSLVYLLFHPVTYMVKLQIELVLTTSIMEITNQPISNLQASSRRLTSGDSFRQDDSSAGGRYTSAWDNPLERTGGIHTRSTNQTLESDDTIRPLGGSGHPVM
jgi:hypothetical protein